MIITQIYKTSKIGVFMLLLTGSQFLFSQDNNLNHVSLFLAYNQIDSLIGIGNIELAREVYEAKKEEGYYVAGWRQYEFSEKLYYQQGKTEQARIELLESIGKGQLNFNYLYENGEEFLKKIETQYGIKTVDEALKINSDLTSKIQDSQQYLIDELIELNRIDQQLYKDKRYKRFRSYWFDKTFGFPTRDSTINHEEAMKGYWEFRYKDSLKTERFVRIIDSLGYVPDERITRGLTGNVLMIHSCKYKKLSVNVDSIYLNSIRRGTISPHNYAWYKGFYDERHTDSHTYYYTIGRKRLEEEFSDAEKKAINARRRLIGLKPCPAVVWNTKIY